MKKFDIEDAVEKRKLIHFSSGPKLVGREIEAAQEDLQDAKNSFHGKRYKWATVQAYYSFFHSSRALLYSKKYREKSHFHLAHAVKSFFVGVGLLPVEYYDNFVQAIDLREMADYKREFSKQGAERNIKAAEEAIALVKKILK